MILFLRTIPICIALLIFIAVGTSAHAQNTDRNDTDTENDFRAVITSQDETAIRAPTTFDASDSVIPDDADASYTWLFGDGSTGTGTQVTHTFDHPGSYAVRLSIRADGQEASDTMHIRVYSTEILLLTDTAVSDEGIESARAAAAEEDIFLRVLRVEADESDPADFLAKAVLSRQNALLRSPLMIVWTGGTTGTDTLVLIGQQIGEIFAQPDRKRDLDNLGIAVITEQAFGLITRPAQTAFSLIRPQYVILTRPEALPVLAITHTTRDAEDAVRDSDIPFRLLGDHSARATERLMPWNVVSYAVNTLVNAGVPHSSVVLALMLPIVATIVAFSRQVIGVRSFGILTPTIVTLSFVELGLYNGLLVFAGILLAAAFARALFKRFHLQYLPRMALVITIVAFVILLLLWIGGITGETAIIGAVFPMLILALLAEQFVDAHFRLGLGTAARLIGETLALAIVSTLIIRWDVMQSLVVGYPELILLTIPINIALGRWAGLRITEYIEFRRLLLPKTK